MLLNNLNGEFLSFALNLAHFSKQENAPICDLPRFLLSNESMVHATTIMFVSYSAAAEHLLPNMIRIIFVFVGLLGNTSLFLAKHALELLSCSLLFLCLQNVSIQVVSYFVFQYLPKNACIFKNSSDGFGRMMSNTENIFRQMSYPKI